MPRTIIEDVIVPEIFVPYVINRTAEISALRESGIITANPMLNQLVNGGGRTINMPFWLDLAGEEQILSDNRPLDTNKITTGQDVAVINYRGNAWASNQLSGALAGSDPMTAIGNLVAKWWDRREQRQLIAMLNGVFDSVSMKALVGGDADEPINADMVLDAKQLLGDAAGQLTAIAMHSATYTNLQKQNLIVYIPNSRGEVTIPTYLTYKVIVDDGMPVKGTGEDRSYTTYLFAQGVIARGEGTPVGSFTPVEMDRDILAGDDVLVHNRAYVLHPMGIKWKGNPADPEDSSPSNSDFEKGVNWERVVELKQIGIVKLEHKVA